MVSSVMAWCSAVDSVNAQGQVLANSEPRLIGKPLHAPAPDPRRQEVLVLTEAVHVGTHWIGVASAAFSQRALDETLHQRLAALQKSPSLLRRRGR